jgi:predicted nucleic acid-binding Zn ribbon protein
MPIYDCKCKECGFVMRNVFHKVDDLPACVECGRGTEHVWMHSPTVEIFKEGYFEHAADEQGKVPYFSSRQKYKAYLKEHGMYADYVEGR